MNCCECKKDRNFCEDCDNYVFFEICFKDILDANEKRVNETANEEAFYTIVCKELQRKIK